MRLAQTKSFEEEKTPEFILWAGPEYLFISADLRKIALEGLEIRLSGASLIFNGRLRSDFESENEVMDHAKNAPEIFSHFLDLPYAVDADRTEVENEDGLISIILRRKNEVLQNNLPSSFLESLRLLGGENGESSSRLEDEIMILETLDRYLEYQRGGNGAT